MAAPLLIPIATAIARAIAAQAAKQGVKKLAQGEARKVARKVIAQKGGPKAVSGRTLDRAVNIANQSSRSGRPTPNVGGGLRTTYSGPPRGKISKVAATRAAEKAAGPRARREGGNAALRATKPKPDVRITRTTSRGTTVTKPVKRETNKKGSAITVRKVAPRKAADVRAESAKARRDKLRDALTPRVNPARVKTQPKRGKTNRDESTAIDRDELQGITIRGKFYSDGNRGLMPRGSKQPTIESRIASRAEKPTRGNVSTTGDKDATILAQRSMRALESAKGASKETVKPGVRTNTTRLIREIKKSTNPADKKAKTAELKRAIRNQRRVLKEREIKEAGERIRKAEEAAAKRNGLLKGRVIKNTGAQ